MDLGLIELRLTDYLSSLGYELSSLTYKKEMGRFVLGVVVDRVEPIDMNAIVKISEEISKYLDEIDNSDEKYFLNISSLGAEKPLKVEDLPKYVSRYVNVHVTNPVEGENIYEGTLTKVDNDTITLSYKNKTRVLTVDIEKSNISKIRLAIKF